MRVFVSWSGPLSQMVAELLSTWLPSVLQRLDEVWISSRDIPAGANWSAEVGHKLAQVDYALICVTKENQKSPWLNFEAGAVSRLQGHAIPILIDFETAADLSMGPLSQLQAIPLSREGLERVVLQINAASRAPLDPSVLDATFRRGWTEFDGELASIYERTASLPHGRQVSEAESKLDELLLTVRRLVSIRPSAREPSSPGNPYPAASVLSFDPLSDLRTRLATLASEVGMDPYGIGATGSSTEITIFSSGIPFTRSSRSRFRELVRKSGFRQTLRFFPVEDASG